MKNIGLFLLLFTQIFTAAAQKKAATPVVNFASFDTAFARVLKNWNAAGFAVAVVKKDKVVFAKGFGYKDFEKKLPATANTQFAIGSCTKAFTASIIGLLAQQQKLDIDKPVINYYPELRFYNNDMNDHITLRDMMCHRTGLTRYDYSWYLFPSASKDSLAMRVKYMEPNFGLREKWQYNNFMFLLQGIVAEKITGKTWEQNVQSLLLDSLGMTNTTLGLEGWLKAADLAKGYNIKNDSTINPLPYYNISGMAPAGSINSSVTDMAKWVTAWINGGKYEGRQVLPSSYVYDAQSQQMAMGSGVPSSASPDIHMGSYGLGWMINSYRSHYRVQHGGNIDGFTALTSFYPADSVGIVVLANQNGSTVPSIITNLIADKILSLPYKDWNTVLKIQDTTGDAASKAAAKKQEFVRKKGTSPSHTLADYTGRFVSEGGESFNVTLEKDTLVVRTLNKTFWMQHYHYDQFAFMEKEPDGSIDTADFELQLLNTFKATFVTGSKGDIDQALLPLQNPDKPFVFTRKAFSPVLTADSLQKYVGEYDLMGQATVTAYIKNNTLYVLVPGQPDYELEPAGIHKFDLKKLKGYSVQFEVDNKGDVTAVSFIQPNGIFKATKKPAKKP